jgi:hypothetical protein
MYEEDPGDEVVKIAAPAISDSLTYIFNQAITLSLFPHEWKTARVIPLYKNGRRNLPGNYRPISVLPVISKIMERILYDQLYNYLNKFELLSDCQFGFRKFHLGRILWPQKSPRKIFPLPSVSI